MYSTIISLSLLLNRWLTRSRLALRPGSGRQESLDHEAADLAHRLAERKPGLWVALVADPAQQDADVRVEQQRSDHVRIAVASQLARLLTRLDDAPDDLSRGGLGSRRAPRSLPGEHQRPGLVHPALVELGEEVHDVVEPLLGGQARVGLPLQQLPRQDAPALEVRGEDSLLLREVIEHGRAGDVGALRYLVHRRPLEAVLEDARDGGVEDPHTSGWTQSLWTSIRPCSVRLWASRPLSAPRRCRRRWSLPTARSPGLARGVL